MRHLVIGLTLLLLVGMASVSFAEQVVSLSSSPSGVNLQNSDEMGMTMKIEIGDIKFFPVSTKGGDFTMMTIDGFSRSFKIGEPNLPVVNRLISVPFGAKLEVEVLGYEFEEISLADYGIEDYIIPVQPSIDKSTDPESVPFEFNQDLYARTDYYTLPLAAAEVLGTMRAVQIGRVSISPVEYNPSTNSIIVYKNIEVRVNFLHPDFALTQQMQDKYISPAFDPLYEKLINYQAMNAGEKGSLITYPIKYVIVSDRMFESQLQPFIAWKTKMGYIVEVYYTDVIGSTNSAIKTHLQGLYENANPPSDPAPSFVLFVGDDQEIPAYQMGAHISDLPYFQYSVPADDFPEIYYGRFSAHTTAELQPQIDKTLEYEEYTMPDPSYLGEVTMVSGVDATYAITYGNGQINYGTNLYFNAAHGITSNTWLYPASDGAGVSAAMIQTVQDGIGFINYTAHCGHTGFGTPSFTTSDIAGLSNAHKYGLGIGNCCLSNTFGADYSTPCFGEAWMQKVDGGGIGYIGATNSTYWDEDYWWGVGNGPIVGEGPTYEQTGIGVYDGVFHDHSEPDSLHYIHNGAMLFSGSMAVTEAGSSHQTYYWEVYHLMGDPSLITYLGVPIENTYTLPSSILITDTEVYIEADPYSYVGLSRDGVLHGSGMIGSGGSGTITIDPFTVPGEIDIVITGQNRQPVVTTGMVIAPDGPYVIYDSHDLNDAAGNNNGMADIGESILVGMQLINVGPNDAENVVANVTSLDPNVTITDGSESYGVILGNNGTSYIADAFSFDVLGTAPDNHKVTFDVEVTGDQRLTWTSKFTVTLHAPTLNYVLVDVDDMSGGNGNNMLEPGETADFTVTLDNSGTGDAFNIAGVLSESDPYVSISDANGAFGDITGSGGSGDNSGDVFTVVADPSCPMGYAVTFYLDITADGGYVNTVTFNITIGDRIVFFSDDFSYDQGWTGLGGNGEWEIGPCVGGTGGNGVGDPTSDHSPTGDNQVLGNDLGSGSSAGDYSNNLSQSYYVYSPIIDAEDYTSIQMTYWHWLGVESSSYDHAYFEVYNGTSWQRLYENGSTLDEGAWTNSFYDLTAYADENPEFQLRWSIGTTDGSSTYCGWNIDDIELKGYYNGSEYKVRIKEDSQSQYGPAGDDATYAITVRNRGAYIDNYDLSYTGVWDVTFRDEADQNDITSTGNIGSLDSGIVLVKVAIPDGTPLHEFDETMVTVTSQGNPIAKDSTYMTTYSAGVPALIPWADIFPTSSLEMQRWFSNAGGEVNNDCIAPPSEPYALNLDGQPDTVVTQMIDLSGQTGAMLSFYYERGGGGDPTETGDNLWVEYKNNTGIWTNLVTYAGADTTMSAFEFVNMELPTTALYSGFQLRFRTAGSGVNNDDWFIDDIRIDLPPAISVLPGMLSQTLVQGESANSDLIIENSGDGSLIYTVDLNYHMIPGGKFASLVNAGMVEPSSRDYGPEFYNVNPDKDAENTLQGQEVLYNAGGPDNFGYFWMDSDESGGPVFNWVDISSTGTDILDTLADDYVYGPFDIGFDFPFYGSTYDQIWISSNGLIGFNDNTLSDRYGDPIPTTNTPNNILAWMWDDLNPADADNPGAHIYVGMVADNLVIQFVDFPEYRADAGDVINAEAILYSNGDIIFQYLDIAPGFDVTNSTIGIENANGTDGLEVCYHTTYAHNGLAVQFSKPYEWLHLDSYSGTVAPSSADTIDCLFTTSTDLTPNTYEADLMINCNDPANPSTSIPVQLEVTGQQTYTCGDASGDGEVNVSDAVYIINFVFVGGNAPDPIEAGDVNCDGTVNVSDAVSIINFVFVGGNTPCDTNGDGEPDC